MVALAYFMRSLCGFRQIVQANPEPSLSSSPEVMILPKLHGLLRRDPSEVFLRMGSVETFLHDGQEFRAKVQRWIQSPTSCMKLPEPGQAGYATESTCGTGAIAQLHLG